MSKRIRVGILTGGGDCPGLNAVIRAVAKSLIIEHGAEVFGFEEGFVGLIEQRHRPLGYRDVSGILTQGGTILGTSNRANPFSYFREDGADVSDRVIAYGRELDLDCVVIIGGDGTMSIGSRFQKKGLNMVGVPKTIDNDIVGTDRCFGFDTAAAIATEALDRIHTTAQSHHRVMIVETMGRYAGWIALYSGTASGADVILIPEFEYDVDEVARVCKLREQGGQRFTIIAVAEGAKPKGGERVVQRTVESSTDPVRLGGVSQVLADQLRDRVESEVRTTILGHVQRGGTPSAFDRVLSTGFGSYAASMVVHGEYGRMVVLKDSLLGSIALERVANRHRTVPPESPVITAAAAVGTSFGVKDLPFHLHPDAMRGKVA